MNSTRRRRSRTGAAAPARQAAPRAVPGSPTPARIGAALLALCCAWVVLGQVGLLRDALVTRGATAQQDLVSVALLGFFGVPLWIGLAAVLRQRRAAFAPWLRGALFLLVGLPPLLGVLGFVLERAG